MFRWSMRYLLVAAAGEFKIKKPGSLSCDRFLNRVLTERPEPLLSSVLNTFCASGPPQNPPYGKFLELRASALAWPFKALNPTK